MMNLKYIRENQIDLDFDGLITNQRMTYCDQDCINYVCNIYKDDLIELDNKYNSFAFYSIYLNSSSKIYHCCGNGIKKPWDDIDHEKETIYELYGQLVSEYYFNYVLNN